MVNKHTVYLSGLCPEPCRSARPFRLHVFACANTRPGRSSDDDLLSHCGEGGPSGFPSPRSRPARRLRPSAEADLLFPPPVPLYGGGGPSGFPPPRPSPARRLRPSAEADLLFPYSEDSPASFRRSAFSAIWSWSMHSWMSPSIKTGRLYIDQLILWSVTRDCG